MMQNIMLLQDLQVYFDLSSIIIKNILCYSTTTRLRILYTKLHIIKSLTLLQDLQEVLKRNLSNTAAKERIEMQIREAETTIKAILTN